LNKILIVEDESIVAMEIKNRLEKLGYKIVGMALTGQQAIKESEENNPDLVLMDIRLKGSMDGIDAADEIKNRFNIPVIYLTAYADRETLKRAKVTEPYGYILKPFTEREVHSNIEMALYKHRIEKKLKENEKQLRNIINSSKELIFAFDKNYNLLTWNKTSERITGFKQKSMIGKNISKLTVFSDYNIILNYLKNIFNGEKYSSIDIDLISKNNVKKIIKTSPSVIIDDGKVVGVLFIGKDITSEIKSYGKLEFGRSYLIMEEYSKSAFQLFLSYVGSDKK